MEAARKVAEAARLRRIEEMKANKRAADEASGSERDGSHRERTAEIKRAVQDRVEAARVQMETARAASRLSRSGGGAGHDDL